MKVWPIGFIALLGCLALSASENPQEVKYCDLMRSPDTYLGKEIRIRAIYKYGFEMQRLESPDCCGEQPVKIWVELGALSGHSRKLFHRFPKGMGLGLAIFTGVLDSGGPFGDGGYRYRFTVDQIEAIEATAHPSAMSLPSWVPQNCRPASEPAKN